MRFILALLLTILLHLILFLNFEAKKEKIKEPKRKIKQPTLNISNFQLKKEPKESPKIEEKKEPIIEQPIIEKKVEDIKPKEIKSKITPKKEIKLTEEKTKKVIQKEIKTTQIKEDKPKTKEDNLSLIVFEALQDKKIKALEKEKKDESLMSFLKTPVKPSKNKAKLLQNQPLKELYEDEFEYLSKEEKEFLEDNLAMIGYITQKYLEYPEIAGMTGQEGINVVEFYLFPNGDISDIKIIKGSNYNMLDKNSIKTIEYAYKEYPRPKQKTKIRIYTHYKIVGY